MKYLMLSILCLIFASCENQQKTPKTSTSTPNYVNTSALQSSSTEKTILEQPENNDPKITKKLRQTIMSDDSLSTNAKSIRVATSNGIVTLRGPVNTQQERNNLALIARSIPGVKNVENQLEIAKQDSSQ